MKQIKDCKYSDEAREKMRLAKLGKPLSEEHRRHLSESKKGRLITPMTPEIIEKIRQAKKGVPNPKVSESLKKAYAEGKYTPSMKGKTWESIYGKEKADIMKKNMGKQNIGKISWIKGKNKENEPIILKYSINNSGQGNHMFGKHLSDETKRKIGEIKKFQCKGVLNGMYGIKGEKNKLYGKQFTDEHKYRLKEKRKFRVLPVKDTKIEVKIQNYLKELKIGFFTHYYCKEIEHSYQCDIFIPVQKSKDFFIKQPIIIECDGDFIHCNPKKYKEDFIRYPKGKNIITAKEKWKIDNDRTKELETKGFKVIRLWENEINNLSLNEFNNVIFIDEHDIKLSDWKTKCLNKIGELN